MSKGNSGLFSGIPSTTQKQSLADFFSSSENKPTATVWNHIVATQETYENTPIPKSFTIDVPRTTTTPNGKMWTHGNATEHIYEALISIKESPRLKNSNPNLYSQFILYDYYQSLGRAVSMGISYKRTMRVGNWEFAFAPARKGKEYPVVKHSLFAGIEK